VFFEICLCVCVCVCVGRQGLLALACSLSRRRKTLIQNRGWRSPLASPCDGRTHQLSRIFLAIGFWVCSLETWDDGAQRLLTLKISLRRLGGQHAVGASAQSVVLTASHSSFIEVPSTGLQVCVLKFVVKRLLQCCQQYVQSKRSNLTHWHPVLGWFAQKTDPRYEMPAESFLCH